MHRPLPTIAFGAALLLSLVTLFLPEAPDAGVELPGLDKAVHALMFALLGITAVWRFGRRPAVVVGLLAYAVLTEVTQAVAYRSRSGDPLDVLADVGGAIAGVLLADAWTRARSGSVEVTSAHDEVAR